MGIRRALVAAGVVIALLVVLLMMRSSDTPSKPTSVATPDHAPAPAAPPPAAAPALPAPAQPAAPVEAQPQPVKLPDGANPPSLETKRSEPAPPQKAFTPDEVIAKREADLKLLDDTKARLEEQLATARNGSDATAVHDLEIRIARLADVRKKRGEELDKLRAGGSAQ